MMNKSIELQTFVFFSILFSLRPFAFKITKNTMISRTPGLPEGFQLHRVPSLPKRSLPGKVVEDDGSESASNASEGSEVSSVAFSKELPRLEALEGFEAEEVKGHHGGPPQNPHEQMTSESSNESDSLSFEKDGTPPGVSVRFCNVVVQNVAQLHRCINVGRFT